MGTQRSTMLAPLCSLGHSEQLAVSRPQHRYSTGHLEYGHTELRRLTPPTPPLDTGTCPRRSRSGTHKRRGQEKRSGLRSLLTNRETEREGSQNSDFAKKRRRVCLTFAYRALLSHPVRAGLGLALTFLQGAYVHACGIDAAAGRFTITGAAQDTAAQYVTVARTHHAMVPQGRPELLRRPWTCSFCGPENAEH